MGEGISGCDNSDLPGQSSERLQALRRDRRYFTLCSKLWSDMVEYVSSSSGSSSISFKNPIQLNPSFLSSGWLVLNFTGNAENLEYFKNKFYWNQTRFYII